MPGRLFWCLSLLPLLCAPLSPAMAEPDTLLYNFTGGADGQYPASALLADKAGNLFGTASFGGKQGVGDVFMLAPGGKLTVLHSFGAGKDGYLPFGSLVADAAGNLYGTAYNGGRHGDGVVFEVTPGGTETVLHAFTGKDGANPLSALVFDAAGNLYGTTFGGGRAGDGVVFKLTASGTETVLHHFSGGQDGAGPAAGLVFGRDGKLYGTTQTGGGSAACQGGCGTVFRTDPSTGRTVVVHAFQGTQNGDGANPVTPILVGKGGTLFGTTYGGGSFACLPGGCGTVFSLAKSGAATILLAFDGDNGGANPEGGLIQDRAGHLFGTATFGGVSGGGIAFRLDPATGAETVLHAFGAGTDGSSPVAGLIFTPAGDLAGTTKRGGQADSGTLFSLSKAAALVTPPTPTR